MEGWKRILLFFSTFFFVFVLRCSLLLVFALPFVVVETGDGRKRGRMADGGGSVGRVSGLCV